ncbi:phage integrase central domain-containing protein [Telmatospirillum sp.]|uniref:phage integrase central domain-containing protein n=1 Tax=Telmatospirillum sp. TaxID=2079197 RepID=UPI00386F87AF
MIGLAPIRPPYIKTGRHRINVTTKQETASRLRGRIEKVLDAAKARGWRTGENPAQWRGHLDHLLPRRQKLQRGHQPAMPYDQVPAFVECLRTRGRCR